MAFHRLDEVRDYTFADQALALRKRAGLTQRELADLLGVTTQSIHTWEAGLSYPGSERLKQLVAFYLDRGVWDAGSEEEEAAALWETVRQRAARRIAPFDPAWFASLGSFRPSVEPERPPTNLPSARTSFVGRAATLARLRQMLNGAEADERLLTLVGVAGCGKTRLALTVAEAVLDGYPDGVWFVELTPLPVDQDEDPALIAAATLTALRQREEANRTPARALVEHLKSQHLMLVLDNCEHVVAAVAALAEQLLPACPGLRIMATSQYPLGLAAETVFRVETLEVPAELGALPTPDQLEQCEAVQLFVERARSVYPDFALTAENAASVVAICRQLDGLPLAIELAAARLNMLPVDELRDRLTDRFRLLRRGGRTVADRHQTLQTTMDWSYRLLEPSDRAVLRRLSVFSGGWDLPAAEAVCSDELVPATAVLEALDELLARSLIYVSLESGVPRYRMLETARHYGLQQLHLTGETALVRDRHLTWCVTLAESSRQSLLRGGEQVPEFERLDREHDNLRAAMQWALERGQATLGLRVAVGLWIYWRTRIYQSEGLRWFAALLALAADGDHQVDPAVRADALEGAAWLAEDEHDFDEASRLFAASSAIRRELGQDDRTSALLINRALEARAVGDYARATALLEESLARHRASGNRESLMHGGLGISLSRLALVLTEQGEYARAIALQEECLAFHRDLGDQEGTAWSLLGLGDIARDQGEPARVRAYCEQSLARFRALGHVPCIAFSLNNLALAAFMEGNLLEAAGYADESAALLRSLHHLAGLAEVLVTLGRIQGAQGRMEAAHASLAEAIDLAREAAPRFVLVTALEALAVEAARQGEVHQAVRILSAMSELRRTMGAPVRAADRAGLDRVLDDAEKILGADGFAAVWREGSSLPLERFVSPG